MSQLRRRLIRKRVLAVREAPQKLLTFVRLMHPDPANLDDADATLYETAKHHEIIAKNLQLVVSGKSKRLIIVIPPRHGKTELATKLFIPWFIGRNSAKSAIVATYSEVYAQDLGRAIRRNLVQPSYQQIFPRTQIRDGSRAATRIELTKGGQIAVVGRGSAITGRGGDLLLVDDPIKDRREADSALIRNQLWDWFNQVFLTRLMTDKGSVVLIQTRWHEDDLVGRLTDPQNSYYNASEARKWKVLHIPAIAETGDPVGRKVGQALWPKRFSAKYLQSIQSQDPRGFSALYQGYPSPADGSFFQEHWLTTYGPEQKPEDKLLRFYMASDHAVSVAQDADKTCLLLFGVDQYNVIWVHPQLTWTRMTADQAIEAALWLVEKFRPVFWFVEKGVINRSIGPFLRKRMVEKQTFVALREFSLTSDKQTRAQSVAGRMSMGHVKFPAYATWWPDAKHEMLGFPYGSNDDFVDALSLIGLGLDALSPAEKDGKTNNLHAHNQPQEKFGTLGWVKKQSAMQARRRATPRAQGW